MNRIYRRLWSTARQCWVVTSELASTKRKSGASTRPLRRSTAAALLMLFGAAGTAHAERNLASCYTASQGCVPSWAWGHDYQWISGNGRFVLLTGNAIKFEGDYATAFGNGITSYGDRNSAFGYGAGVAGGYATAVGAFANATGIGATAIGNDANAYGGNAVALGSKATVITGAGVSGIAIGADSRAGTQGWTGAIALGGEASASHDSIALGYQARSSAANSVALGRGSQATEAYTVSVGNGSTKRRIVNVADGTISSSSTDAVNGRQLQVAKNDINAAKATATTAKTTADQALANSRVVTQASASGTVRVGGDNTGTTVSFANKNNATRYLNGIRNGALSTTSTDAVTGQQLFATNANVTKAQSAADAAQSSANSVKTTADSALSKANGLAGLVSQASATGNVRLGGENTGTVLDVRNKANANRRISGLADATLNTSSTEAVTGKQLTATNANVTTAQNTATAAQTAATGARTTADSALGKATALGGLLSQASASGTVRVGGDNTGSAVSVANKNNATRYINGIRNGALSATSTDAVTGQQLFATNANVTKAQTAADAAQSSANSAKTTADTALGKATALGGLVSQASATGNVRLGGDNTGTVLDVRNKSDAGRKITGLSDGTLSSTSTDAVTGKQLTATNTKVTTAQNTATAAQTAAAGAKTTADTALGKANVLGGLVSQASATGNVRLGGDNTGTVLDVRNKSDAGRKVTGLSDGTLSSTSTDAVTGRQLTATNANVTTAQNTATAAQTAAAGAKTTADTALGKANVLGGLVSQASATGNVRLGAENTGTVVDVANKDGAKRRVNNVANGVVSSTSTDVVTGQQLHATNQAVSTQGQSLVLHGQQLATHTQSLAAQDQRVSTNRTDIEQLRSDVDNFDPDLDGVVKFSADRHLVDMDGARVSGVSAGDINSAGSTDAVNGGQLFATNERMLALEGAGKFLSVGAGGDQDPASAGRFSVAIGDSAEASVGGEGGVAVGGYAVARGTNSVAIGRAASVRAGASGAFALGVRSLVESEGGLAVGAESRIMSGAVDSVAMGSHSVASERHTVSFGHDNLQRRLVHVARGMAATDAATVAQLSESLSGLGGGASVDGVGSIIGPVYNVQGGAQNNVGDALSALDGAVIRSGRSVESIESQLRSTFQQSPFAREDGIGQLNLAGAQGMLLSNLADGRIAAGSRDAVTGNQLYATEQKIERNRRDLDAIQRDWSSEQRNLLTTTGDGNPIDFGGARLTGVADARLSADSSDVVRGSQLYSTNLRLNSIEEMSSNFAFGWMPEDWQYPAEAGPAAVAIGKNARASLGSEGGVAVGAWATAQGKNSVALGRASYVHEQAEDGFAVGGRTQVAARGGIALGAGSEVRSNAINSVAIGWQSIANDANTVSFGNDSLKRRLTGVANGRNANDAATIGQLRGALSTLGSNIDANGNVTTPGFNLQGQHHTTVNDALTTLDAAVVTTDSRVDRVETHLRSVFQETPSTRSDGAAQLTLAGANGMVISNVANGLIAAGSREAVNGGQLHAVQQQLNGRMDGLEQRVDGPPQARAMATASADAGAPTPTPTSSESAAATPPAANEGDKAVAGSGSAPSSPPTPQPKSKKDDAPAPTPQVDTAELEKMLARANEYTDGAIKGVEQRLDKMDKRFNRMAAMSSAQTAMAMNTAGLATYNRLGAGVGYSDGESAMAVGYQRVLNEKGSATFSLNGAFTNSGEQSVGLGVGIGW
ncbi:ESPR-type extended signal peptide-containing protein [Stenotrophomonas sp. 364]|uniref:ESPR-type extended signal peptide-containing protein n=1 Tax=Stenotrophomonas sp. 364 TaxID=2691571 RepID=UPI001317B0DA|nr:ESPR-type extended signal peptide-containing protein [Stenotrophomonas sp. 364]QHB72577.1 hemagluttinin domain-containing protein [Stenotrophomonas sp. 364]